MIKRSLFAVLLLSGCATVQDGPRQMVVVSSDPNGAECTAANAVGSQSFVTPSTIEVGRSKTPLVVTCTHAGAHARVEVQSKYSGASSKANAAGLAGMFIGAAIDAASGAANEYPKEIVVMMGDKK